MFNKRDNPVLVDLGNWQELQILQKSASLRTFHLKDETIVCMFLKLIQGRRCLVIYVNDDRYQQHIVLNSAWGLSATKEAEIPITKELWLYFYAMFFALSIFHGNEVNAQFELSDKDNNQNFEEQILKAARAHFRLALLCPLPKVAAALTLFDKHELLSSIFVCVALFASEPKKNSLKGVSSLHPVRAEYGHNNLRGWGPTNCISLITHAILYARPLNWKQCIKGVRHELKRYELFFDVIELLNSLNCVCNASDYRKSWPGGGRLNYLA